MTKRKKIIILLVSVVIVINLVPYLINTYRYADFVKAVPMDKKWEGHVKSEKGYVYLVQKPPYLSFEGYLSINKHVVKTNDQFSLIIWPLVLGGYEYGFRVQKDGESHEIYIDKNMKPTHENEDIEGSRQIVEENKKELELLFKKANGMFSL
ncbi:hypothetical protein [Priestia megaterium]|uniref:hypothetical protein n=2 Tax=Priestia megaterium TaxID=1404 RepID=UPI0018CF1865|nr:hypothetical protein [Priestia megaterium]MBG9475753.1 hypothetical protein [Priestia megaterium]MDD9795697.1 hypothetical protein [Priestia megaterium]